MATCEKCWADSHRIAATSGVAQVNEYRRLLDERDEAGQACTPAEQCGEMHLVLEWKDGGRRCRCGAVVVRMIQKENPNIPTDVSRDNPPT